MSGYPITVDQLEDGHALVLGTTGSGKTYQLRGMLEQLRGADRRVGAIDKLGNHWGLTFAPDGKEPGLDFVIFGGKRAQVPMTPDQGELLGRLFVERDLPAIFDVSQWHSDDQQRWVAAFADAVFRANQERALHFALDEAQSWVPQGGGGDAFRAVQRLAEQGRGNGIRLLMSCQRLSRLDATVRGMVHLVVAMRQPGVLDRKAVKDLIASTPEDLALLDRDLPKMPTGTGYRWSADDAELTRIAFPENATFDSSRTPRHGDTPPAPVAVSSALVDELRATLTQDPADDIPADPAAAHAKGGVVADLLLERDRRIFTLERTVACRDDRIATLELVARRSLELANRLVGDIDQVVRLLQPDDAYSHAADANSHVAATAPIARPLPPPRPSNPGTPPRGRKALQALANYHPAALTETQWATLAGYSKTGGTWGTYKGELRRAGLIEEAAGLWRATAAGVVEAGGAIAPLPAPGPDLAVFWGRAIPGVRRMVEVLVKRSPHWTTRDGLAADLAMAAAGGTFGTYLGRLRANGLIEEQGRKVRLTAALMGGTW